MQRRVTPVNNPRSARAVVTLVLVTVALLAGAGTQIASAHTTLAYANPATGATVVSIEQVELKFTAPLEPDLSRFSIVAADGTTPELQPIAIDERNTRVRLTPTSALSPGLYRASFQAVPTDGHPTEGYIQFEVSPDGQPHASPWTDPSGAGPTDPLSAERFATDPALTWVLVLGAVIFTLGVVYLIRVRRSKTP